MRISRQAKVLQSLLNCELKEIIKHEHTVYEWKEIFYEVVKYQNKTAPASHYTTIFMYKKKWSIRELGDKSKIVKNIKRKNA